MIERRPVRRRIGQILQGLKQMAHAAPPRLSARDAYRLWAATYDAQPDNVVLALEETLFSDLLARVTLEGRAVLDVGCGTGRHWTRLLARRPSKLIGVDTSPEMLARLRARIPEAELHLVSSTRLDGISDASVDVLVSTLTMGHILDVHSALREWARVLRPGGDMILTDFHPEAFRGGMKRTFKHGGTTYEVENYAHPPSELAKIFHSLALDLRETCERSTNDDIRASFERRHGEAAFRRFRGTPILIGMMLARSKDP